jgi:SAM-dependent methyltransferase
MSLVDQQEGFLGMFTARSSQEEVWASDFKLKSVTWCTNYLPSELMVFLNTYHPSLPIRDGFFDVITAFSVFTHIDELEIPWLLELDRVLAPGGLVYLTIHDENSWVNMSEQLRTPIAKSPEALGVDFLKPMGFDRRAFTFDAVLYYANVFHSSVYVRQKWGRIFDIVDIIPMHHNFQAVVIAKKKRR